MHRIHVFNIDIMCTRSGTMRTYSVAAAAMVIRCGFSAVHCFDDGDPIATRLKFRLPSPTPSTGVHVSVVHGDGLSGGGDSGAS
jgi:hypothetical protein